MIKVDIDELSNYKSIKFLNNLMTIRTIRLLFPIVCLSLKKVSDEKIMRGEFCVITTEFCIFVRFHVCQEGSFMTICESYESKIRKNTQL